MLSKKHFSTGQINSMKSMTPEAACWLLRFRSTSSLRSSATLPRNSDGSYDAADLLAWKVTEATRKHRAESLAATPDALEYKRRLEAKKLEIQLMEMEKAIISIETADAFFALLTSRLRDLGELLQRQYGRDALSLLNECLDDVEATIERWRATVDGNEDC